MYRRLSSEVLSSMEFHSSLSSPVSVGPSACTYWTRNLSSMALIMTLCCCAFSRCNTLHASKLLGRSELPCLQVCYTAAQLMHRRCLVNRELNQNERIVNC